MSQVHVFVKDHDQSTFERFARITESKLRESLSAALGSEVGRNAAAEALEYAWENWSKVGQMDNPLGYVYVVGRNRGRRMLRARPVVLLTSEDDRMPWVETGLTDALAALSDQQRVAVMLLYCFQWTYSEVAELMGVGRSTVQRHVERGLATLRSQLGVSA